MPHQPLPRAKISATGGPGWGATGPLGVVATRLRHKSDSKMTFQGPRESDSKMTQNLTPSQTKVIFGVLFKSLFLDPEKSFLSQASVTVAQRRFTTLGRRRRLLLCVCCVCCERRVRRLVVCTCLHAVFCLVCFCTSLLIPFWSLSRFSVGRFCVSCLLSAPLLFFRL